jgi:hypothetical protein
VSLAPLESPTYPRASALAWFLVVVTCAAVLGACERDPGRRAVGKEIA